MEISKAEQMPDENQDSETQRRLFLRNAALVAGGVVAAGMVGQANAQSPHTPGPEILPRDPNDLWDEYKRFLQRTKNPFIDIPFAIPLGAVNIAGVVHLADPPENS